MISATSRSADTIAKTPATFTRYPNGGTPVFDVTRARPGQTLATILRLEMLREWGLLEIPGHLWRAMSRFSSWIDPLLAAEWGRLTRRYAGRMHVAVGPGEIEGALAWVEPRRTTAFGRELVRRLIDRGDDVRWVRTTERLRIGSHDVDHCLP